MSIVYYDNGQKVREDHIGFVISKHEKASFMDSYYTDYYAVVWNPTKNTPETIEYWCDRSEGSHAVATVDAPEEIKEAYKKHQHEEHLKYVARLEADRAAEEARKKEEAAKRPHRGQMLVVVRGRKLSHGTSGVCFWSGETRFGRSVGLKLANGSKVFTAERNVKVVR